MTGLAEFRSGLDSYLVYGIPAFDSYVLRIYSAENEHAA